MQTTEGNFVIIPESGNMYLQLLKPIKQKAATNNNTSPPFPDGSIGIMHAIPTIGTKFNRPEVMGPQSQKNVRQGSVPLTGVLYFDFR